MERRRNEEFGLTLAGPVEFDEEFRHAIIDEVDFVVRHQPDDALSRQGGLVEGGDEIRMGIEGGNENTKQSPQSQHYRTHRDCSYGHMLGKASKGYSMVVTHSFITSVSVLRFGELIIWHE